MESHGNIKSFFNLSVWFADKSCFGQTVVVCYPSENCILYHAQLKVKSWSNVMIQCFKKPKNFFIFIYTLSGYKNCIQRGMRIQYYNKYYVVSEYSSLVSDKRMTLSKPVKITQMNYD